MISAFRLFSACLGISILLHHEVLGQTLGTESKEVQELSDGFYFGGNATVGTGFFGGRAGSLFSSPFLAKGGISLAWNHWSLEANATFMNGRQKTDFQLVGQDFRKNDRYTMIGAQTHVGYWFPLTNRIWLLPTVGLSYLTLMPGSTELSDSKTLVKGTFGCPGAGLFIGQKWKKRKRETDAPHLEFIGLRYEIIWPGFTSISGPMHQIGLSITGLMSRW